IFGDSLNDVGNASFASTLFNPPTVPPPDLYFTTQPAGVPAPLTRFSGGPVWAERLAEALGRPPLLPSLLGGTHYAFGGASVVAPSIFAGVPKVGDQVGLYRYGDPSLGLTGHTPASNDLFVFWAGANDFFASFSYDPFNPVAALDASNVAGALVDQV